MKKIPRWKRILSHMFPFHLESNHSEISGALEVRLVKGRLQLSTDNAVYSFEDKYINFVRAFEHIDWSRIRTKKALVLGFGLGSVVHILEKQGKLFDSMVCVEKDEAVLELASRYTMPQMRHSLEMISADAADFLRSDPRHYDLILHDIFIGDLIPPKFQQENHLRRLSAALEKDGILLYNTLAFSEEDRKKSKKLFENVFRSVFPQAAILDVAHNYIYINDRRFLAR